MVRPGPFSSNFATMRPLLLAIQQWLVITNQSDRCHWLLQVGHCIVAVWQLSISWVSSQNRRSRWSAYFKNEGYTELLAA